MDLSIYQPFLVKLPVIVVWIVGIILAYKIRTQNKRVAKFVSIGLIFALLETVANFIIHVNILAQYVQGTVSVEQLATTNVILQVSEIVGVLVLSISLLVAIFKPYKKSDVKKS